MLSITEFVVACKLESAYERLQRLYGVLADFQFHIVAYVDE